MKKYKKNPNITFTNKPLFGLFTRVSSIIPSDVVYFSTNKKIYRFDSRLQDFRLIKDPLINFYKPWKDGYFYLTPLINSNSINHLKELVNYIDSPGARRLSIKVVKNPAFDQVRSEFNSKHIKYVESLFAGTIKPLNISKNAETFILNLSNAQNFEGRILKPGRYIIKLHNKNQQRPNGLTPDSIEYLKELSKYDLIPKIVYIDHWMYVQKFIPDSIDFQKILEEEISRPALYKYVFEKVKRKIQKWHKLGFSHRDLAPRNILLTKSGDIFLIDPNEINLGTKGFRDDLSGLSNLKYNIKGKQETIT